MHTQKLTPLAELNELIQYSDKTLVSNFPDKHYLYTENLS